MYCRGCEKANSESMNFQARIIHSFSSNHYLLHISGFDIGEAAVFYVDLSDYMSGFPLELFLEDTPEEVKSKKEVGLIPLRDWLATEALNPREAKPESKSQMELKNW